ncbi:HNH endonuclease signature motif containing protein [Brachybacterium sp. FME24]|uniref:HNH endonuclease signature motif containing protein n=1 Tax=Brachybacterium sp. FME24 TaxID=2742605 RepID=UPI0018664C56|nr:HNH endonuclease signature motif containing protein [Brachybacterium sp. FME24]
MSAVTCGSSAESGDEGRGVDPSVLAFLDSLPRRLRQVNARKPLTRAALPVRGESTGDPVLSAAAQRAWDAEKNSALALAERYRAVAALYSCEVDGEVPEDEDDLDTVRTALALRVTHGVANWELRTAHQAVDQFPRTLELLGTGRFPSWWFSRMLREARSLTDESRRLIDMAIATWSTDITAERFVTLLNALVQLMARREEEPEEERAEPVRTVELAPEALQGIGSITVRGPIPEILAYWKSLEESAQGIQAAQRKALKEGGDIPFDMDEIATRTGRPIPLARLRYALTLGAHLDADGAKVPAERFRLNVTVPALTLLGASDAPGMVEGRHPIPPGMARSLAGTSSTWFRVLTEPSTGAFLPCPPEKYQPDTAMLEHLRLRNSTCAVPGCTRSTSWAAEGDHIEEYNHVEPSRGGRTEIENLHLLCWQHHLEKTLGLLDPTRLPTPRNDPGRTTWRVGAPGDHVVTTDDIDIATRIAVRQLEQAWVLHADRNTAGKSPSPPGPAAGEDPPGHDPEPGGAPGPPIIPRPPDEHRPAAPEIPPGPWDPDDPPPF